MVYISLAILLLSTLNENRWMDGWMDGWLNGWMDGWMDG